MKFSLIICTYKRSQALFALLQSVKQQTLYPNEILIVDGSPDEATQLMLAQNLFLNLQYYKVADKDRGLTKQRNYGIERVSEVNEVVCFLDDDTILTPNYFEEIITTYMIYPEALGVGGYITNEVTWEYVGTDYVPNVKAFIMMDGKGKRVRVLFGGKKLGLDSDVPPGCSPDFSHGRSVGFLPPSGKVYAVEQLIGGVSSFRKSVFESFQFSTYFEGYGLYEDADFTLRVSKVGKLYLNTAAQLEHHHDASGRPNQYSYGKMVVRNGWYVWRVKNLKPTLKAQLKWHAITLLLTAIRGTNCITSSQKKAAFTETFGRIAGWFSLFWDSPQSK